MLYDYLIVGAGLYGSIVAYEAAKRGKKVLVIEKRSHIAGNIYTEKQEGINVHKYGAHIFHTSNKEVWEYMNQFSTFKPFINSPLAVYKDKVYNLPFNMNTFYQLWGTKTPDEAKAMINSQIKQHYKQFPANLEEQAINLVGIEIYETLIKGYTEKQWGRPCTSLPAFIIKRLPVRFTYDNNYFNDLYQGIPEGGYTTIIEKMLENVEVKLQTDYYENRSYFDSVAKKVVYTGPIDQFFDYALGVLGYRSLRFETEILDSENYQGNAVINYTDVSVPYTRIIEHKHFDSSYSNKTIITKEYPENWQLGKEAFYPINDEINNNILASYNELKKNYPNHYFGGRLADYKYYDMHIVVENALKFVKDEFD